MWDDHLLLMMYFTKPVQIAYRTTAGFQTGCETVLQAGTRLNLRLTVSTDKLSTFRKWMWRQTQSEKRSSNIQVKEQHAKYTFEYKRETMQHRKLSWFKRLHLPEGSFSVCGGWEIRLTSLWCPRSPTYCWPHCEHQQKSTFSEQPWSQKRMEK